MKSFKQFILYNNTIPLVFGILFLGAGATFAASPEARDAVVGSETRLASVDNSYLLNTVIDDSTVVVTIGSVTENAEMYFVEYQITNMDVVDGAWQPVTNSKVLEVSKDALAGRDLGLYAAEELSEVQALYVRKLKEYQDIDRRAGITPKTIATEYEGLVGQFLDPQLEVFPTYDPLIEPIVSPPSKEWIAEQNLQERLAEEVKRKEQELQQVPQGDSTISNDSGGDLAPENPPPTDPVVDTPPADAPEQPTEVPPEEPATEPAPTEPIIEPPLTLESIGL